MEVKKNPKANLESYRGTFMLLGLVFALVVAIVIFSISKPNVKVDVFDTQMGTIMEEEEMQVTRQDVEVTPPPQTEQTESDVIDVVDDDVKIKNNFNFDTETSDDDAVVFDDLGTDVGVSFDQEDEPVVWAEQMPEFPGGIVALKQFIAENVDYPTEAQENEIEGTVYLRFVVTKSGKVGEVQLVRGVDQLLDNAAMAVVKKLPDFKPGMQGGRTVPVWYSVPIVFQLTH